MPRVISKTKKKPVRRSATRAPAKPKPTRVVKRQVAPEPRRSRLRQDRALAASRDLGIAVLMFATMASAMSMWRLTGPVIDTTGLTDPKPYQWFVSDYAGYKLLLPRDWQVKTFVVSNGEALVESVILTNQEERVVIYSEPQPDGARVLGVTSEADDARLGEGVVSDTFTPMEGVASTVVGSTEMVSVITQKYHAFNK